MKTNLVFAQQPPESAPDAVSHIDSGPFWPRIGLGDLRSAMRIDQTVTHERLRHAATAAVLHVNRQLAAYRSAALQSGLTALAEVKLEDSINGEPVGVYRYRRAVYAYTMAEVMENYADHTATGNSAARADAKQMQADDYRREAHAALADIMGTPRVDCEII